MKKMGLVFSLLVVLSACADEAVVEVGPSELESAAEIDLGQPDGKADGIGSACREFVHQPSADVTVLRAQTIGRAASASNTVPADFNVDMGACDVLSDEAHDGFDCQFFDDCREQDLDCSDEIAQMTDAHFAGEALFHNVIYTMREVPEDAPSNNAGQKVERYHHEGFNCQVLEIETLSRAAALPHAKGLGVYYDGKVSFIPSNELDPIATATLKNGEEGVVHRFAGLTLCWSGSVSSSSAGSTNFKPFMLFADKETCWLNWDKVPTNYRIDINTKRFDRSGELVR